MKRKILFSSMCSTLLLMGSASSAAAADASTGLDFSTAYVFRGAAVNDSFVAQPYLEVGDFAGVKGLSVGTWANFDMDDGSGGNPESGHFSEIDLYGSYELPIGFDSLSLSLGYTEYAYPRSESDADREVGLVAAFDTLLSPSLGVYVGVDGAIDEGVYIEGSLGHDVALNEAMSLSLGGTAAALFQPRGSEADDGFSYASLSAGLSYSFLTASATYYIETDDKVLRVEEEVVGTIGLSAEF